MEENFLHESCPRKYLYRVLNKRINNVTMKKWEKVFFFFQSSVIFCRYCFLMTKVSFGKKCKGKNKFGLQASSINFLKKRFVCYSVNAEWIMEKKEDLFPKKCFFLHIIIVRMIIILRRKKNETFFRISARSIRVIFSILPQRSTCISVLMFNSLLARLLIKMIKSIVRTVGTATRKEEEKFNDGLSS